MAVPFSRSHLTKRIHDFERSLRQKEEAFLPLWRQQDDPYRKNHPLNHNVSVGIWKGWNAALIVSKQKGLPVFARDGSIEEAEANESKNKIEPSSVKPSLTRKRKRIEGHPTAFLFDGMSEEDIQMIKEGVDAISMHVLVEVKYLRLLREFLGDDSYRSFVESLFRSVAKFVLSVFDKDDFKKIHHHKKVLAEGQSFCSMLPDEIGIATKEEVVVKAVDTVIKESHRFPAITDNDYCLILGLYAKRVERFGKFTGTEGLRITSCHFMVSPFKFWLSSIAFVDESLQFLNTIDSRLTDNPISRLIKRGRLQEEDICKSVRNNVIEDVMQNFVPLKDYCKTQLALELMCSNGYRVFDTLLIEVLKNVEIDSLFKISRKIPELDDGIDSVRSFSDGREVVSLVLSTFVKALQQLGLFKSIALTRSQEALSHGLSNIFGPCKSEVIEVIKIADHERRSNNKPSISLENINYGLSLSRVGEFVQEIPAGSSPKLSVFEFFKLSRQKASEMGHKKIGLKHLILTMNTVLRKDLVENASLVPDDGAAEEDLKCLKRRNINNRSVRVWNEVSPMHRILRSKYRIFDSAYLPSAGSAVKCVKKVRKSRFDPSWIRRKRRRRLTPSSP